METITRYVRLGSVITVTWKPTEGWTDLSLGERNHTLKWILYIRRLVALGVELGSVGTNQALRDKAEA